MGSTQTQARPVIAPPEEDPNAIVVGSSPPCLMHELDPVWLGYLARGEVAGLLEELLAAERFGTVLETAWRQAMLRRHLDRLNIRLDRIPRRTDRARTDDDPDSGPVDGRHDQLVGQLRAALPRLHDDALRRDLADLLRAMERDLQRRHGRRAQA